MGGSNGPWRGHFGSGFEGGMRAPAMVRWPGKVNAGGVSDEIFSTVEWLPTLASLVGESGESPRPPHRRIDASSFFLGESPTNGRDHVIYFGSDAEVMSVKWKTMKVVFRYSKSNSGPIFMPQWPYIFDLSTTRSSNGTGRQSLDARGCCRPVAMKLGASGKARPSTRIVKPGEEFTGY